MRLLAVLALALAPTDAGPTRPDGTDADRPAPTLQPPVPPIELAEDRPAPPDGALARDGWVADRFTAEGQSARYAFDARAGELSLFDLGTWGYSRGWKDTAGLRVLGPDGAVLASLEREGGTTSRLFLAFVAPAEGTYAVEPRAVVQSFRYTLVRHSSYHARVEGERPTVGRDGTLHGYLADAQDAAHFRVPVQAGRPTLVRVQATLDAARNVARQARAAAPESLAEGASPRPQVDRAEAESSPEADLRRRLRRAQGMVYPLYALEVTDAAGATLASGVHSLFLVPREDCVLDVSVRAGDGPGGGLFELVVARDLERVDAHGRVADGDDEPRAGVELVFVHAREHDVVARVTSGADGTWSTPLLPGDYVVLQRAPGGAYERLHATVRAGLEELNTICER